MSVKEQPMGRLTKSIRIYRLIDLLNTKRHYLTSKVIAEELGVAERTVYRDIDALTRLGVPVYNDNGYKLLDTVHIRKPDLTPDDIQTLKMLIQASPLMKINDLKQRSALLVAKLESLFPRGGLDEEIAFSTADVIKPERLKVKIRDLEAALGEKRVCRILYHGLKDPVPQERTIFPYAITIRAGCWYLVAFDRDREDYRTFRLERILEMTIQADQFRRDERFCINEFFANSWGVFRGDPTRVEIRLTGYAARLAAERNWPAERSIAWQDAETAILTATVEGTEELLAWTLSMGRHAQILSPESLREQAIHEAEQILECYRQDN